MSTRENLLSKCADAEGRGGPALSPMKPCEHRPTASSDARLMFRSVLTRASNDGQATEESERPAFFRDLNLDQVVASITIGKQEYNLAPFFHLALKTVEAVEYRQDVMRDLQDPPRLEAVNAFANGLRTVRDHVAQAAKLHYKIQNLAWLLDAIELYGATVKELLSALRAAPPRSTGLIGFLAYLDAHVASADFQQMIANAGALKANLASIRYNLLIGYSFVTVSAYRGEADYGAEIQSDFEKFRQGAASDHLFKFNEFPQMNHIEAGVLERVTRLFPQTFAELESFIARNVNFFDATISRFDREVQFYVAYIDYMRSMNNAGLPFCFPKASAESKEESVSDCYDLALARKLIDAKQTIVANDYFLDGRERILIVSGPNQGGKTTFARTFGQLHHLATLGLPVPAKSARLFLSDRLFTHFEKEEDIHNLRGKLHDDLARLRETLSEATSDSIIILNEVFNSTSLKDAIFLSAKVLATIIGLDAVCVCVTFIDELASLSRTTVSMASNVNPEDVAQRTFKITRRPPDGLAYAISVAEKYGLTYRQLAERLSR
jgi:DNA mismatch repair protein MutS